MKKSIVAMMLSGAMTLVIPFYSLAQTQTIPVQLEDAGFNI
ncbi:hypothetical protein [Vibrio metschnikovii]